jgi:hypothetical protein
MNPNMEHFANYCKRMDEYMPRRRSDPIHRNLEQADMTEQRHHRCIDPDYRIHEQSVDDDH